MQRQNTTFLVRNVDIAIPRIVFVSRNNHFENFHEIESRTRFYFGFGRRVLHARGSVSRSGGIPSIRIDIEHQGFSEHTRQRVGQIDSFQFGIGEQFLPAAGQIMTVQIQRIERIDGITHRFLVEIGGKIKRNDLFLVIFIRQLQIVIGVIEQVYGCGEFNVEGVFRAAVHDDRQFFQTAQAEQVPGKVAYGKLIVALRIHRHAEIGFQVGQTCFFVNLAFTGSTERIAGEVHRHEGNVVTLFVPSGPENKRRGFQFEIEFSVCRRSTDTEAVKDVNVFVRTVFFHLLHFRYRIDGAGNGRPIPLLNTPQAETDGIFQELVNVGQTELRPRNFYLCDT